VLFDYGDTLFRFHYDERAHERALGVLLSHLGAEASAAAAFQAFWRLFEEATAEAGDHGELRYAELMMQVLASIGVEPGEQELAEAIRLEHRAWDEARELHPDTVALLRTLRRAGIRLGLVSNAFDPPDLMHEDLRLHGIADLLDAAVFSSELGVRKPHPAIYQAVLDRLGVPAERALFVGDRVREDVLGPAALGMATCLATYYRQDEGDHSRADFRARSVLDILRFVGVSEAFAG
jgi:putative hydrolase of the HAD superfamily